ncbi:MAG: glycosyltransferase family 2 protein [Thomasclavelia ramosa]|nr:glycosyltransferase family 2 protein [Thomasclavelia ramosa]
MNNYVDIAFVILHFNTLQETSDCVNSIICNIDTDNYYIVIVDNCSENDSLKILKNKYNKDSKIKIIMNEANLGFACGNNIGIKYAKEKLHATYICCLNNDTLLMQKDFFETLNSAYSVDKPAVIGPQVILKDNSIQKIRPYLLSINEYRKHLDVYQLIMKKSFKQKMKEYLLKYKLIRFINTMKHSISDEVKFEDDSYYKKQHKDILLHGCCLVFTPIFFEVLEGFCEETFLYYEEEILYLDLMNAGIHSLYYPSLLIRHLEDAATNSMVTNNYEKKLFMTEHKLNSVQILINHLQKF